MLCWRQLDDGYYRSNPAAINAGLKQLEAMDGVVEPGTLAYVRAFGLYRLVNVSKKKDLALDQLEAADRLLADPPRPELKLEYLALRAAIDGELAGMGRMDLAIRYGIKSQSEASRAVGMGPHNGRALFAEGMIKGNMPEAYGGSNREAIDRLKASVATFANQPADGIFGWGEADADAWLGIFYLRANDRVNARHAFEAALKVRPDFKWVAKNLLPKVANPSDPAAAPINQPSS
jgi:hypothetical protein